MNIFKTKNGKTVITQKPNWPLYAALVLLVAYAATGNQPLELAFYAVLIYWALLEAINGVNTFRRMLGMIVLVVTTRTLYLFFTT